MSRRLRLSLVAVALLALLAPTIATASVTPPEGAQGASHTFDTPSPTVKPTPRATRNDDPRPKETPPAADPVLELVALPQPGAPSAGSLTVAYRGDSIVAQAPLLLAEIKGYFEDEGLNDVLVARANDSVADLANGDADIGVVRYEDAQDLVRDVPGTKAIAGYLNYADAAGAFGGDALLARAGLVQHDPATVIAFLKAYLRALQELADEDKVDAALDAIEAETDLAVDAALRDRWARSVQRYRPLDGGFGDIRKGDGLGELTDFLRGRADEDPDLDPLIVAYPLNLVQALLGLPLNPAGDLIAPPGLKEIRIGLATSSAASSPIGVADAAGYFSDVGFDSVEIVDVESPLPGVMTAQLDLAVVDLQDAADGVTQGLPIKAIAGHRNYLDGSHVGDVIIASPDLIEQEGATVVAFLVAYIRALADLTDSVGADGFAPHDGGFGDRADGGGLGELAASLDERVGDGASVDDLVARDPLTVAQAWWGLPANPTTAAPLITADDGADAPTEEAA